MGDPSLSPEPWQLHLLGLITPILVITGNYLGTTSPIFVSMGVVFVWGVAPLLDLVMGDSEDPRPPRESGTPFEILLWCHGLTHLVVLASFFWFAFNEGMTLWLIVAALSTGLSAAASAIVTAHELGHKKPRSPGWRLARVLLFSINYPHFTTEHNHNHHKWVATERDPASPTSNQGLWSFWASTIPGQFSSSVRIHNRKGRTGLSNPSYQGLLLQTAAIVSLAIVPGHMRWFDGTPLVVGWLVASAIAILTLEYVNYIRHWGLRRSVDDRLEARHSWNTEARWSRWSLLELTRHSDHHMRSSVPFWQLRPHEGTPELRWGYYASWWPCLVPPIWKRVMTDRLPDN